VHTLQRAQLRAEMGRLSDQRARIERATRAFAEDAIERLRAAGARHQALLASQCATLDRCFEAMQRLAAQVQGAADLGAAEFLGAAAALEDACRHLGSRALAPLPPPADLQTEAAAYEDLAGSYAQLVDLLAAKDALIQQLLQERERAPAPGAAGSGAQAGQPDSCGTQARPAVPGSVSGGSSSLPGRDDARTAVATLELARRLSAMQPGSALHKQQGGGAHCDSVMQRDASPHRAQARFDM
jgi:hypothetical protein